jgi:hypothetical protein
MTRATLTAELSMLDLELARLNLRKGELEQILADLDNGKVTDRQIERYPVVRWRRPIVGGQPMTDLEFILRVLDVTAVNDAHEQILWSVRGSEAEFYVKCSDVFWWGTADAERLTPHNIDAYEQAFADLKALDEIGEAYADTLFACRMRKMRPQGCCYPPERHLWPLFDACGPEREKGIGNPYAPGEREEIEARKKILAEASP